MREIGIDSVSDSMRLDRLLKQRLPLINAGFLQKMLRKKNIVVNGKKVTASYRVREGDVVSLYLSEETLSQLTGDSDALEARIRLCRETYAHLSGDAGDPPRIVYEDEALMLIDKPAGVLSQRDASPDGSVNEWMIGHLLATGSVSPDDLMTLRPGIANRLDRGTTGLMIAAKSAPSARAVSALLAEGLLEKHYLAIVAGTAPEYGEGEGVTWKRLSAASADALSLLDVTLLEGKKHRIRMSLAGIGYPVAGDRRYGDEALNRSLRERFQVTAQLLHSHTLTFPGDVPNVLKSVAGRTFTAEPSSLFSAVCAAYFKEQQ